MDKPKQNPGRPKKSQNKHAVKKYLVAQVDSVMDNKSYKLIFFEFVKFRNYLPYYTRDLERPEQIVNKENLVLLKPPEYSYQPRVIAQNAKSSSTDTDMVHKYFFPNCLQETVKSHFERSTTMY